MTGITRMYWVVLVLFAIFSYGFVDHNLDLSTSLLYQAIQKPLRQLVFDTRGVTTGIFLGFILILFALYIYLVRFADRRMFSHSTMKRLLLGIAMITLLTYPAFSYDIFNYILTAKLTYFYHENPYIVMPIEIPNEPMLAFTRAANKVALYGPVWIFMTLFPYSLGMNTMWVSLITFKLLIICFYLFFVFLIYRYTKSWRQVIFFALNPLIVVEVLISGHNDITMMVLAITGLVFVWKKELRGKVLGYFLLASSPLVKGATIVLIPLLCMKKLKLERVFRLAFWFMAGIFLLTPLREEMYPWYAVWFLAFAAFIPIRLTSFTHGLSIAISFGLLLRYLPYIYTREYGGVGPMIRIAVTTIPVLAFLAFRLLRKRKSLCIIS